MNVAILFDAVKRVFQKKKELLGVTCPAHVAENGRLGDLRSLTTVVEPINSKLVSHRSCGPRY